VPRDRSLPPYSDAPDCKATIATQVIEIFEPRCAHELRVAGELVASSGPALSALHRLNVPESAYQAERTLDLQLPRHRCADMRKRS